MGLIMFQNLKISTTLFFIGHQKLNFNKFYKKNISQQEVLPVHSHFLFHSTTKK